MTTLCVEQLPVRSQISQPIMAVLIECKSSILLCAKISSFFFVNALFQDWIIVCLDVASSVAQNI